MDLFTGKLPETIMVCGKEYPIDTGFRTWVRFDDVFMSRDISPEKLAELFSCVFPRKVMPESFQETMDALILFYSCGEKKKEPTKGGEIKENSGIHKRSFHFVYDSSLIYGAFLSQYGIDLVHENLHWWLFRALFDALEDRHKIIKVMEYRSADISKIKDKERRAFYRRMKQVYRLPDFRDKSEIERENMNNLAKLF